MGRSSSKPAPNEPPANQSRNDQQSDQQHVTTGTHSSNTSSSSTERHRSRPPNEPPVTHSTNEHQEPDQRDVAPVRQRRSSSTRRIEVRLRHPFQLTLLDESYSKIHINSHLQKYGILGSIMKAQGLKKEDTTTEKEMDLMFKFLEEVNTKQSLVPWSSSPYPPNRQSGPSMTRSSSYEFLPPNMSELRVVLLGNSWSERSSVGNFILGKTKFNTEEEPDHCLTERGWLEEKEMVLINTPDLLIQNIDQQRMHIGFCQILSAPGPHVFLLVLQPEDFTEEHRLKLCKVLELFSDRSFHHSLVLISTPREESPGFMEEYRQHPPLKEMIRKCQYRFLWRKDLELSELLTRLGQIVNENNGEHVNA